VNCEGEHPHPETEGKPASDVDEYENADAPTTAKSSGIIDKGCVWIHESAGKISWAFYGKRFSCCNHEPALAIAAGRNSKTLVLN
jgi:hypothetical protein